MTWMLGDGAGAALAETASAPAFPAPTPGVPSFPICLDFGGS